MKIQDNGLGLDHLVNGGPDLNQLFFTVWQIGKMSQAASNSKQHLQYRADGINALSISIYKILIVVSMA